MATAMASGSFDVIHKGHLHYLKEAKKHGDKLVVVVARDKNILKFKGRKPKFNEAERIKHVKELKIADEVVFGHEDDIFDIVEDVNPDVICLGYDQKVTTEELKKRNIGAEVLRMSAFKPDVYKSSRLKSSK